MVLTIDIWSAENTDRLVQPHQRWLEECKLQHSQASAGTSPWNEIPLHHQIHEQSTSTTNQSSEATLLVWLKQGNEKQTTTGQHNGVGGDQTKTKTK